MRWVAYIDPSGWADCSAGSHLSRRTAPPDLAPFPAGSRGGCRGFAGPVPSASLDALPEIPRRLTARSCSHGSEVGARASITNRLGGEGGEGQTPVHAAVHE